MRGIRNYILRIVMLAILLLTIFAQFPQRALAEVPRCYGGWTTDGSDSLAQEDCGTGMWLRYSATYGVKLYKTDSPVVYKPDKCYVTVGLEVAELPTTEKTPDGKDFPPCNMLKFYSALGKQCYSSYSAPTSLGDPPTNIAGRATASNCYDGFFDTFRNDPFADGTVHPLTNGHCYIIDQLKRVEIPNAKNPAGNTYPTCAQLAEWADFAHNNPPKCYSYDEATKPIGILTKEVFNSSKNKAISCKDLNPYWRFGPNAQLDLTDIENKQKTGQDNGDLAPGMCYLFTKDLNSASESCELFNILLGLPPPANAGSAADDTGECKATGSDATKCCTKQADGSILCKPNASSYAIDCKTNKCDITKSFIEPVIKFLTAGVGFVIVAVVVAAGIRFSAAGSDPQKKASAQKMITNAVIALVTYIFLFSILQWLLPKGWLL